MIGKASYATIVIHVFHQARGAAYGNTSAGTDTRHESSRNHQLLQLTKRHKRVPEYEPHVACHPNRAPTIGFSKRCEEEGTQSEPEERDQHDHLRSDCTDVNIELDNA